MSSVNAVILAGGVGSRFSSGAPKQLANLAGHPILHHTVRRFADCRFIDSLFIAANPEWHDQIERIVRRAVHDKPWVLVDGGESRNDSVHAAVDSMADVEARVLVQDGVRPLVSEELILRVVERLETARSVVPVIPSADPLVLVDGTRVGHVVSRETHMRGQSPQGFWLSDLRAAFCSGQQNSAGDYSTLFEFLAARIEGFETQTVDGEFSNIKVTMPVDRMIAGQILLGDGTL